MQTTNEKTCTKGSCAACMMPFSKDRGNRENPAYCSYCFNNGKLNVEGYTLQQFQDMCYSMMRKNGTPWILAKFYTFMIRFAPYWKNKK